MLVVLGPLQLEALLTRHLTWADPLVVLVLVWAAPKRSLPSLLLQRRKESFSFNIATMKSPAHAAPPRLYGDTVTLYGCLTVCTSDTHSGNCHYCPQRGLVVSNLLVILSICIEILSQWQPYSCRCKLPREEKKRLGPVYQCSGSPPSPQPGTARGHVLDSTYCKFRMTSRVDRY